MCETMFVNECKITDTTDEITACESINDVYI